MPDDPCGIRPHPAGTICDPVQTLFEKLEDRQEILSTTLQAIQAAITAMRIQLDSVIAMMGTPDKNLPSRLAILEQSVTDFHAAGRDIPVRLSIVEEHVRELQSTGQRRFSVNMTIWTAILASALTLIVQFVLHIAKP
jgi:hypothetical protein